MRISPRRSPLLLAWWLVLHGLAALSLVLSAIGLPVKGLALLALAGHVRWRFPGKVPDLLLSETGEWAVPALGRSGRGLAAESGGAGWWIRLVLTGGGRRLTYVLFEDQLEPGAWRALQAGLCTSSRIK